jgi:hypothetical protein
MKSYWQNRIVSVQSFQDGRCWLLFEHLDLNPSFVYPLVKDAVYEVIHVVDPWADSFLLIILQKRMSVRFEFETYQEAKKVMNLIDSCKT